MAKVTDEQMIQAIKLNAGIVMGIMKTIKDTYGVEITRDAIYKRKESNPRVRQAFIEAEETTLDVAENRLIKSITAGQLKAIMFYLRTKGKNRGYSTRQEITGEDGKPIQTDPLSKFTKEELLELAGLTKATNAPGKD